MDYQLMPPLSESEYQALKTDIQKRGVMVPVEYDEFGNILDGYHRVKICKELGITEWPRLVRSGMDEDEKKEYAIALNLVRRHITDEQRKAIWLKLRQEGKTLQQIVAIDGTVGYEKIRQQINVTNSGNVPLTVVDTKGRVQPTFKPRKTVFLSEQVVKQANALPEAYRDAVLNGQTQPLEARREAKIAELSKTVNLPDAKYRVVLADPPWSYGNTMPDYETEQRDHYPVMTLEDICAMPIKDMTLDDAVLFLWVTSPILEESFQVVHAWGFQYKASFVWDKVKHNMGHYNSVRHEFLLVCTKGSCQPDVRKLFDSVITEERTEHSKKPEYVYEIIKTLYPYGKCLELFSRKKRIGWDAYGFEA